MEDYYWYEGIEKEINSLKEKMSKGDYSAYELDSLLHVAKRISSLSEKCNECAELKGEITNAIKGLANWPNTSKEEKKTYIFEFRTSANHLKKYHPLTKNGKSMFGYKKLIIIGITCIALAAVMAYAYGSAAWEGRTDLQVFPYEFGMLSLVIIGPIFIIVGVIRWFKSD